MDDQMWEVETAAVLGWQAVERRWLGRWLLRAADGFTGRANSVLPLGPPDRPVSDAVAEVRRWYGSRDLTPTIVVPHPLGVPIDDPLDTFLATAGWGLRHGPAVVMTARSDHVAVRCAAIGHDIDHGDAHGPGHGDAHGPGHGDAHGGSRVSPGGHADGHSIEILAAPTPDWVDLYHYQGVDAPPVAARLLMSAPWQAFALARGARPTVGAPAPAGGDTTATDTGRGRGGVDPITSGAVTTPSGVDRGAPAAIGRISVGAGWAGLTAIEVAPAYRRRGLAVAVIGSLVRHARAERGAQRVYVQVQEDNGPALALYSRCGFAPSHRYHYRIAEGANTTRSCSDSGRSRRTVPGTWA